MFGQKQLRRASSLRGCVSGRLATDEKLTWAVLSDNVIDELCFDRIHDKVCGSRDEMAISHDSDGRVIYESERKLEGPDMIGIEVG